jgi:hypothetical protein
VSSASGGGDASSFDVRYVPAPGKGHAHDLDRASGSDWSDLHQCREQRPFGHALGKIALVCSLRHLAKAIHVLQIRDP